MPRKSKFLARAAGIVGAGLLRALVGTVRLRIVVEEPWLNPFDPACSSDFIFAIWHDVLLVPTVRIGVLRQYTLISQSRDGETIARIAEKLGWKVIRGSSSRGAGTALRRLIALNQDGSRIHVAITCDGPRGPRHVMKEGPIYLASRAGMAIIPVGVAHQRGWRAKSWDRFVIPRPFTRAVMFGGAPLSVPAEANKAELEAARVELQSRMDRAEQIAERILADDVAGRPTSDVPLHELRPAA